jgi:hypothetical protein
VGGLTTAQKLKNFNKPEAAMSDLYVALISFGGTLLGTLGGIIASARLTTYRLKQLEIKVDKHNCLVERTYKIEGHLQVLDEQIKDLKEG